MFSKSRTRSEAGSLPAGGSKGGATFSVIGGDVVITGDVRATVDLHIDGRIIGDVSCASLVQGEASHISGAVEADQARLAGSVDGSLSVKNLILESTARISGDVSYETVNVALGARIDGRLSHLSSSAPQQLKLVTASE